MNKKLGFFAVVSKMTSQYLHYFLILNLILAMGNLPKAGWIPCMILLGAIIISYIFREVFSRAIGIIIVHALMIFLVCLIIPDLQLKIIIAIEIGVETLFAAGYIISGYVLVKDMEMPYPSFVLLVFTSGYAVYMKDSVLLRETFIVGIFIYLLYILLIYLINLDAYIKSTKNVSGVPLEKMVPMNSVIVLCIFTIMTVAVILADKLGFADAIWRFIKASLKVLFIIFKLISAFIKIIGSLFGPERGDSTGFQRDMMIVQETVEDSSILDDIVTFLLKVIILAIAIYLIVRLFRAFYRYLIVRRQKASGDAIIKISKPDMSKTKVEKISKEKKDSYFTPEQKARRIYKKKVESVRKKYIPAMNHTAGDILERYNRAELDLKPDNPKDLTEVTKLYEAVRYGNVHPDQKYLKKMQNS